MLHRIRKLLDKKAVVLMYHRIVQVDTDPWQLAVSPANFEEQLQVLRKSYQVIPLQDLIAQHARGIVSQGSVCITFDDGYSDNYLHAKPLLEKYRCPASFFLPVHFINRRQQFWWDELENILLRKAQLPAALTVNINHQSYVFELGNGGLLTPEQWQKHTSWAWPDLPPTKRCEVYLELWKQIRPLPLHEIEVVMRHVKSWAAMEAKFHELDLPMTQQQVEDIVRDPLFNLGIHTITHPDLSSHSIDVQHHEIAGCAAYLKTNYNQAVHTIAYPYGNYNSDTLSLVKEQQLAAAFTTQEKFITKRSDPHQLGRFHVKNWGGKDFEPRLKKWSKTWFH